MKVVRIISEQFDEKGQATVTTTTETTSTLVKVSDQTYSLKHETVVELAGRRFGNDEQSVTQGYYGESAGQLVTIKKKEGADLVIGGATYPTETSEVTIKGGQTRRTSVIQGNAKLIPYSLKRVTTEHADDGTAVATITVEVVALDMPFQVLGGELCTVALIKTVETRTDGASAISYEAQCSDVPGGMVWQTTKVLNPAGKVLRRSVVDLIDYQIAGQGEEGGQTAAARRRRFHRQRPVPPPTAEKPRRN